MVRVLPCGRVAQPLAVLWKSVVEARSACEENVFKKVWGRCLTFKGKKIIRADMARLVLIVFPLTLKVHANDLSDNMHPQCPDARCHM